MNAATSAFKAVLDQIGLTSDQFGSVDLVGEDPIVASPHRIGAANAAALAAHAAGIAAIWRLRTGRDQEIRVDVRRAVIPGLLPLNYLSQNGYLLGWQARKRVPNFFPTKDDRRFYLLHAIDYPQLLLRTLDFLDCSNSEGALTKVIAGWKADELEEALAEQKLVGGIARSKEEWAAHPQGRWLAAQPAVAIEKIGESTPEPFGPAPRPLTGIRVLDMGHVLAGPTAARTLAEQGADVLRISSPGNPDPTIQLMDTGFGKRSAYIDLDQPDDVERLRELARETDVFSQSWRPGALDRRGLSPDELAALRPGLIYLSISCYGNGGPWWDRGGYDPLGQAVCGMSFDEGTPDGPQLVPTFTLNDYVTAYLGAAGVTAALIRRAHEGGSYHIKVSLTRSSMFVQELGLLPEGSQPAERTVPAADPAHIMRTTTPWGELGHAAPIVEYSETKAAWDRPTEPLGTSLAEWQSPTVRKAVFRR